MRSVKILPLCLLLATACSTQSATQSPQPTGDVALFEGARLITGDGDAPIEDSAFIVENARFTSIGKKGALQLPEGAIRVDLTGKTVMPALINAHAHMGYRKGVSFGPENYTRENILDQLNHYAYYGVAAVLSAGTDLGELPYQLRDESHPGALFRTAGRGLAMPDAGPSGPMRPSAYGVTTEEEARKDVQELAVKKVDLVKIWVDDRNGTVEKLHPNLYRAIIDEAHKHNLIVIAHSATLADAKDLLRVGIDGFAHPIRDAKYELDDEVMGLLKQRPNVFLALTLWGERRGIYGGRPAWLDEPLLHDGYSAEQIKLLDASAQTADADKRSREGWARTARNVAKLNAGGVRLVLGTDAGGSSGGPFLGWAEHVELESMVAAGMTPAQVIVAATRTPAEILHLDQLGTVAAGKSADFIVLDANPLENITNTRRIAKVYLRGKEVDRAGLRAGWNNRATN